MNRAWVCWRAAGRGSPRDPKAPPGPQHPTARLDSAASNWSLPAAVSSCSRPPSPPAARLHSTQPPATGVCPQPVRRLRAVSVREERRCEGAHAGTNTGTKLGSCSQDWRRSEEGEEDQWKISGAHYRGSRSARAPGGDSAPCSASPGWWWFHLQLGGSGL